MLESICILRGIAKNIMEKQHECYWILWLKSFSPSHKLLCLRVEFWRQLSEKRRQLLFGPSSLSGVDSSCCWLIRLCRHLAGDWQEQTLRQSGYCSWEGNLLGTVSRHPPPPQYTFTTLFKHRQDCLTLVSIHFFRCLIVWLWPSIVQVV